MIVCLGRIAFDRVLRMFAMRDSSLVFAHGAYYELDPATGEHAWMRKGDHWLLCSYHPSQQNTLTGKLTAAMFDEIWARAHELADHA